MKFNNVLALGSLLAMAGSALAVPVPEAAVRVVTVTRVKVMGITRTKYVPPATKAVTTTSSIVTTTTTTSSSTVEETSTSTSTSSSSTSSAEEEEEEETSTTETPTPTPTPEPETTTTEQEKETPTPKPAPPAEEPEELEELEDVKEEEKPEEKPEPAPVKETTPPSSGADSFHGEATYFDPGMGSCGETHGPDDLIAAISFQVMDPKNPGNPNNNPLCGKKIQCMRNGDPSTKTIVTVVDRCPVCVAGDLDLSPAAYKSLGGTIEEGRFNIDCIWL